MPFGNIRLHYRIKLFCLCLLRPCFPDKPTSFGNLCCILCCNVGDISHFSANLQLAGSKVNSADGLRQFIEVLAW